MLCIIQEPVQNWDLLWSVREEDELMGVERGIGNLDEDEDEAENSF